MSDHESGTTSSYDLDQEVDVETESSDETEGLTEAQGETRSSRVVGASAVKKGNIGRCPPRLVEERERNSDTTTDSMGHPSHRSKSESEGTNGARVKSKKMRYPIECPFCATSNMVHIAATSFQLQNIVCCSDHCGQEYWVQIHDGEPIVTKKYPAATTIPANALRNMRGQNETRRDDGHRRENARV